ncbi:MAG TPA: hypothetical protein VKV20_15575 [Ktedonobacteraceae bacterium]|jgi:hypothetical protein|nr:hypothetical protein [Ktedonobacteraceae bacterium]
MQSPNRSRRKALVIGIGVLVASLLVATFAYRVAATRVTQASPAATPTPVVKVASPTIPPTVPPGATPTLTPTPVPTLAPTTDPAKILGIDSIPPQTMPGLSWIRLGYPTCGQGVSGTELQQKIQGLHAQGIHVLLVTCQSPNPSHLLDTKPLQDVAHSGADAVECGNEQMKYDPPLTAYVSPDAFARFYDLCQRLVHAVQPSIPVLMGSLDPHVGGVDYSPLVDQANYLNQMQYAMNTSVHPGGNWSWRSHAIGLIDSWHNGYPNQYTNSLYGLFVFWAQQFGVNLNSGALGKHIWVVEGTGCFKGCGIDPYSPYQVAVSHILTLITDVQTTMRYGVPFFYFKTQDFVTEGELWPMGVFNLRGQAKPLRQDLPPGARTLVMSCAGQQVTVFYQPTLLLKLYSGCTLPADYIAILAS